MMQVATWGRIRPHVWPGWMTQASAATLPYTTSPLFEFSNRPFCHIQPHVSVSFFMSNCGTILVYVKIYRYVFNPMTIINHYISKFTLIPRRSHSLIWAVRTNVTFQILDFSPIYILNPAAWSIVRVASPLVVSLHGPCNAWTYPPPRIPAAQENLSLYKLHPFLSCREGKEQSRKSQING